MAALVRNSTRSVGKLVGKNPVLFLCDMQEKFKNNIQYFPQIVEVSNRILRAFKILDLPVICTEQYPEGLGKTVPEVGIEEFNITPYPKKQFSMCVDPVKEALIQNNAEAVVMCGIEAHVCIQNTALDLVEMGVDVHLVADACSSRTMVDRIYGFERMRSAGVFVTTSESMILALAGGAHHPKFRDLQKLILISAPDSGLLNNQLK